MEGDLACVELYLREIGREPLLTRRQEARLARRIQRNGDREALDRLVRSNLRFVVSVAKRYRGRGLPFEDLINEGNVGLLRAAERFDPDRGVRFVSYAVWWIRRSILQALARAAEGSPADRPEAGRPGRARTDLRAGAAAGRRGRSPARRVSLHAPRRGARQAPLLETTADPAAEAPDAVVLRRALRDTLEVGLAGLPEEEERVLRCYFGLDGGRPRTLTEIGRELGVGPEAARRMKARGLARLRSGPRRASLRALRD